MLAKVYSGVRVGSEYFKWSGVDKARLITSYLSGA